MVLTHTRWLILAFVILTLSRSQVESVARPCVEEPVHDVYIGALLSIDFNSTMKERISNQVKADFAHRFGYSGHQTLYSIKTLVVRSRPSNKALVVMKLFDASPNLNLLKKFVITNFVTKTAPGSPVALDFSYVAVKLHRTQRSAIKEQQGYILETCKLKISPFCNFREVCVDSDTIHSCELCERGTFKNLRRKKCVPCITGKTTPINGATKQSLCTPECAPGFQHNRIDGTCVPCPQGYRRSESDPYCLWDSDSEEPNRLIDIRVSATFVDAGANCKSQLAVGQYIPILLTDYDYFKNYEAALCRDSIPNSCYSVGISNNDPDSICKPDCETKENCTRFRSDIVITAYNVRERSADMESEFNRSTVDILKDFLFGYQYNFATLEPDDISYGIVKINEEPTVTILSDSDYTDRIISLQADLALAPPQFVLNSQIFYQLFIANIELLYVGEYNDTYNRTAKKYHVETLLYFKNPVDMDRMIILADALTQSGLVVGGRAFLNSVPTERIPGGVSFAACKQGDRLVRCSLDVNCNNAADVAGKCQGTN